MVGRWLVGRWLVIAVLASGMGLAGNAAGAQQNSDQQSLLLVLDASGSMNARDASGRPKIDSAKDALRTLVDGLEPGAPVGLRVYGHRVPNNDKAKGCGDSELVAPVKPLERESMKAAIGSFKAKGFTPIGFSLQEAAKDLPRSGERTIILVSDGADTCAPPDPCDVAKQLEGQGIDLKIQTIGFQVDDAARSQLQCIAAATGGDYIDAPDAARLTQTLTRVSARALRQFVARGVPIHGGPTRATAVKVTAGQYLDEVTTNDDKWFAVDLEEGETLGGAATMVLTGSEISKQASMSVAILGATDEEAASDFDQVGAGSNVLSVGAAGKPVTSKEGERQYIHITMKDVIDSDTLGEKIPLEVVVKVIPSKTARRDAVGTTPPRAERSAEDSPSSAGSDNNLLLLSLAGFVALLLGVLLGWVAVARRQR